MVPFSICYFIDILFYILRKWLLIKNLARILSLKSKLPGKCRRFYAINKSIKILKKNLIFQKFQLNWKIVKHFTGPKQLAALMKLFCVLTTHSPSGKILLRLWKKTFFTEIYRNILTFAFKVLQELGVKKWWSANVVSDTKQKHVCWKTCSKVRKAFGSVAGACNFQCQVSWDLKNEWGFLSETVL